MELLPQITNLPTLPRVSFAPCLTHTPLLIAWFVHPSLLHSFAPPCLQHSPPILAWFVHPLLLHSLTLNFASCLTHTPLLLARFVQPANEHSLSAPWMSAKKTDWSGKTMWLNMLLVCTIQSYVGSPSDEGRERALSKSCASTLPSLSSTRSLPIIQFPPYFCLLRLDTWCYSKRSSIPSCTHTRWDHPILLAWTLQAIASNQQ